MTTDKTDTQTVSDNKWWDDQHAVELAEFNKIDTEEAIAVAQPVIPTRHTSNDSRDRIQFLKHMVGNPVPDNFDPHEISWALPNLGVTWSEGAEEALDRGHFVINVAGELMNDATVKMPIEPWGKSSKPTVLPMLESIVNMMEMAMATEQKVVVHCSMGMERSVLATVWYLVRHKGMDLDNAYSFVRSVRPIATDRREWIIS